MKQEHIDALSALMDGEPCEPGLLAESLAQPESAAVLADFAALRVLARSDLGEPGDTFYATMAGQLRGAGPTHRFVPGWKALGVAASFVLAAFVAGYWVAPGGAPLPAVSAPPAARFEVRSPFIGSRAPLPPAGAPARGARGPADGSLTVPPAPALRIRFAEWRDTAEPKARLVARMESSDAQH